MTDMTLCRGGDCGIKSSCSRWDNNTKPCEYRQAYFVKPPFTKKMDGTACEHYVYYRQYGVK